MNALQRNLVRPPVQIQTRREFATGSVFVNTGKSEGLTTKISLSGALGGHVGVETDIGQLGG